MPYFECPICHFALKQKGLMFSTGTIIYYVCINPECQNFKHIYIEESEKLGNDFKVAVVMRDSKPLVNPIISENPPKSCDQFDIKPKKPRKTKERVAYDYGIGSSKRRHSYNKKNY